MADLIASNQLFLKKIFQKSVNINIDSIIDRTLVGGDSELKEWISCKEKIIVHPQIFPSEEGVQNYQLLVEGLDINSGVAQYIGVTETDPHLIWYLLKLRQLEIDFGIDPDKQETQLNYKPSLLISLGTGDGLFLAEMLERFQPIHLCIALRSTDDLISSFENIDWTSLWNNRCLDPRQKISFFTYSTTEELRSMITESMYIQSEHAFIVVPGKKVDSRYIEDRDNLCNREMAVRTNYLGFTIDEYNMVWNTVQSLLQKPRIYSKPLRKLGGNFIVCGSGPSLDSSLEFIKKASTNSVIIACASNYRTLRAAGISVDILCVLERGSFEYENYKQIKEEFGVGNTRLFASVTCDSRLHTIFDESMVFFRPQLTPISIFSRSPYEILMHEGPQTVNTGLAFCAALGANNVILVGVDLGTANLEKVRSENAVGDSPRQFNLSAKGNFNDKVWTTSLLLDGALALESCIKTFTEMNVYNASNGLYIKGAKPVELNSLNWLITPNSQEVSEKNMLWENWWDQKSMIEKDELLELWTATRVRALISDTSSELRTLLQSSKPWFIDVQEKLEEVMRLDIPMNRQVSRRLFRAVILKMTLTISRQNYVLLAQKASDELQFSFMKKARDLMVQLTDQLEIESYELCDLIEEQLL
ncbi:DUF115 domain-containing protein [Synechococcus sp. AH-601-N10]|nr:DUF115 domain-containing protein [Synechococcus sp. AH-601-N10]